ncbi:AEC family transporter [Algicella marina]|uniref:AEC family transporter n=1 Tax=Algicella marina TaxID=2683284 RepID=A0A6P1T3Q0_9RHOB|nr:AEC family transporter [Algicella marina]QHQ36340.1 AEC family transporter [Algicella marina]
MIEVLSISGTIFALIAVGYLAVLWKVFAEAELRTLGTYVVRFALPALVFRAVSGRELGEILNAGYLGGYLIGSLAVLVVGYVSALRMFGQSRVAATFHAMGMSCANSGFIGYPIVLMALPSVAATALALNMIVENLVLIPLILILAEASSGSARGWPMVRTIGRRLATNPITVALVAGLAVSLLGIPLPRVIAEPVNLIAASSAALSLLVIGGTLVGLQVRAVDRQVLVVVAGKLLLLPLAVWAGIVLMGAIGLEVGDGKLVEAAILIAATPAMGIYPLLAQQYGEEKSAAMAMLLMTVFSFFTITGLLLLLQV